MKEIFSLAVCLAIISQCCAVNILVLEGVASPSHHLWNTNVLYALAAKGYNITSISADIDKSATPNVHYLHLDKVYDRLYNSEDVKFNYIEIGKVNPWVSMKSFYDFTMMSCEGSVMSSGWKQLENYPDDFKFDLVIHDYPAHFCLLAFVDKFNNPPLIGMTAFNDVTIGSSLIRGILAPSISTHFAFKDLKVSFLDRVDNYLIQIADYTYRQLFLHRQMSNAINRLGNMPTTIDVSQLIHRHKFLMFNHDPAIDTAEYLPANVFGIGGLQIQVPKPLPDDLQRVMDESKAGVVLFSLGTNVEMDMLGDELLTHILEAFRRLPQYTFLCKFHLDTLPVSLPANVIMRKWIPQNDVLGHAKTKLFITHAGLLSTQESVWHGVPMLGIPVFADQFLNIQKSIRKGIAEMIYWNDLTRDHLYGKIKQILETPSYAKSMTEVSALFRDQKETPLERAIWYIEWTLRHPNATHLQSVGNDFTFVQLQSIDVLATIFTGFLFIGWMLKCVICCILRRVIGKVGEKKQRKDKHD